MKLSHTPLALACAALVAFASCAEETRYAYFEVNVQIDAQTVDDDLRRTIASCALIVEGDDEDAVSLPCTLDAVPYSLGVAEFSTNRERGQLIFTALMRNLDNQIVARGSSPPVAIVPETRTPTTVVAVGMPAAPDGGTGTDAASPPPSDAGTGDTDAGTGDADAP